MSDSHRISGDSHISATLDVSNAEKTSYDKSKPIITAIIPFYNESGRVGKVVATLCQVELVDEIILVDDGSNDGSMAEAIDAARDDTRLRPCQHLLNQGKGQAIFTGWHATKAATLLLLDADLINLKPQHIENLITPVLDGQADMTMGLFKHGYWRADAAHWLTPWLTGQRCILSEILCNVSRDAAKGYGFETALTIAARKHGYRSAIVPLIGVTHPLGEIPRGGYHGFSSKFFLFYQVVRAWILARKSVDEVEKNIRQERTT